MSRKIPENSVFAPMEEADKLCNLLFMWLKKRKQCAEKLLALAKELENLHKKSTISQVVGSATSVAAMSTAGIVTLLTGGLATPILVATTVGTIAGAAVDIASSTAEAIISSSTMKEAKNITREDEKIGKDIQEAIEGLKKRCGMQQNGAHGSTDVGCEVAAQIMGALARRNNTDVPLDLLRTFIRSTFFTRLGGLHAAGAVSHDLIFAALTFVCWQMGIECFEKSLEAGAKGLGKSIASTGLKTAAKAGLKLLGMIGFGISLYGLISSCEELAKTNQGTKASQALLHAAEEVQEARRNLEKQLDAMNEITKKMSHLKNLIMNLRGYSLSLTEQREQIINYISQSWSDNDTVVSWLQMNPVAFTNLIHFFVMEMTQHQERLKEKSGGHINIVIVAHGEIRNELIPASLMMPTTMITDTVLYSPWNCLIDCFAACAIAEGWNNPEGREFYNCEQNQQVQFEPNPLPPHWNNMRTGTGTFFPVPLILLTPVYPEEPVWKKFQELKGHMDRDDRVIIPYIVPEYYVKAYGKMPFFMFLIALSYLLMIINKTATVHLAACLGHTESERNSELWRAQYAYTNDKTVMTNFNRQIRNLKLFRALKAMFA